MTEHLTTNDLAQARIEAALLLRLDPASLSASDTLRCDLVASLRLVVDDASATVLDGRAPDLARLLTATETLIKLLPAEPKPAVNHDADPRQQMWEIYRTMRARGELAGPKYSLDAALKRIAELEAQLAGGPAPALPECRYGLPDALATIDPTEVVPPSEWRGETYARPGPDDPKPGPIIEGSRTERNRSGVANQAPAAPPSRPPDFDDTDSGRLWNEWRTAGGYGVDRWANRNE